MENAGKLSFTFARLALGAIVLVHGVANTFGVWGGPGVDEAGKDIAAQVSVSPTSMATVVSLVELLAGLALLLGSFARVAAIVMAALVVVHMLASARFKAFFVRDNGLEYLLAIAALCIVVAVNGPGRFCLDIKKLMSKKPKK